MSDVILRGLMLPDSRSSVSNTSNVNTSNSILKGLQLDAQEEEQQGAQTLSVLDSLRLSQSSSTNSRGSVPIQLMAPDEMSGQQLAVQTKKSNGNSTFNALSNLRPSSKAPQKNSGSGNAVLTGLMASSSSNIKPQNQAIGNLSVPVSYSTVSTSSTNNVSKINKVNDKINSAIEKIETWNRKIGILDAEIKKQKETGSSDPSKVITRTSQMATAKKDAVLSRDEALKAYNNVITELTNTFGSVNINEMGNCKNGYLRMEALFAAAQEKDKGVMAKTKDYLSAIMTPDNFKRALDYLNPFN